MKNNHEEIQSRLHQAEAIADLIGVAEPCHLCGDTLANAAEALRVLVQHAREMHAVAGLDRRAPAAIHSAA